MSVVAGPVVDGPFKGLTPFEDSDLDAVLFFGREREREVIAANLLASRLTVLYGASGVGKSSVLRAGVVHHLRTMARRNLETRGHPEFVVVVFDAWTQDPMAALLDAVEAELREVFGPELAPHDRRDTPAETLDDWTARLDCDLLLVLDQTEEYFLYHEEEEGPGTFAGELPELVTKPGLRVSVLLAIRDDALARLDRFKGRIPNLFANYLRLDHLDKRAGRAAILGPLEQYNEIAKPEPRAAIEPELVEALLDETTAGRVSLGQRGRGVVRQGGVRTRVEAPYLQLVLYRLWEEERAAGSSVLRLETLERLGGANEVVRTHLERALAELPSEDKDVAADVFSHLVTPSGTKIAHGLHDLAEYAHVREERLEPIVSRLVSERILRPVAKGANGRANGAIEAPPYEIFHDVLGDAVLDWRMRHESERRVAHEREEADRRHRRVLGILVAVLVALAAMTAVAAYAVAKRSEARREAERATAAATFAKQQQQVAEQEKANAEVAKNDAVREKNNAEQAEAEAEVQRQRAEEQQAAAEAGEAEAQLQEGRALDAQASAESAAQRATAASIVANREKRSALSARAKAEREERRANAQLLLAQARDEITKDPAQTLRLALKAAALVTLPEAETVLREGIVELRIKAILNGGGPLVGAVFGRNGSIVATASSSASPGEARIYQTSPPRLLHVFPHSSGVSTMALSRDGRLLATGSENGDVRVWDTASGALQLTKQHAARVRSLEFSSDGRLLASGSNDRTARVWDLASDVQLRSFAHPVPVKSARFSPDGDLLVTVPLSVDRVARVYDVAIGELVAELQHGGAPTSAQFTHDGSAVVSTGTRNIFVWRKPAWRPQVLASQPAAQFRGVSISPNGERLVSWDNAGLGRVWRMDTGAQITMLIRHEGSINSAIFAPDSATVLTSSDDLTARIWTGTQSELHTALVGHREPVVSAVYDPSGEKVLTASVDRTARLWDAASEPTLTPLASERHAGAAVTLDVTGNGRLAASGGADGKVRIWRTSGGLVRTLDHGGSVTTVDFSNDGRLVLSAGEDGKATVWRVADGRALASVRHGGAIRAALSGDGRWVVTAGGDVVRTWAAGGRALQTLRHDDVAGVALSPSGRLVATGSEDGSTRLWNLRDGRLVRALKGHTGPVVALQFSPDGTRVATASGDTTARVWTVASGVSRELTGHQEALTSISWSRDGRRVVAPTIDGQVRSWWVRGKGEDVGFRGHVSFVGDARFSPDGRWIVTAGPSAVGLFVAATGRRTYFLRGPTGNLTHAMFTANSLRIIASSNDGTVRTYLCSECGTLAQLRRLAKRRLDQIVQVGFGN